jgi:hypothetical protein
MEYHVAKYRKIIRLWKFLHASQNNFILEENNNTH